MGAHFNWQPGIIEEMPLADILDHFKAAQAMVTK